MKQNVLNRIKTITGNTVRQIVVATCSMMIPFLVIRLTSIEIWGALVSILLYVLLATSVVNWGSKEYLLRMFSEMPSKINVQFSQNTATRAPLVVLFSMVALLLFPVHYFLWIFLWLTGRFLLHSSEVLVLFEKKFQKTIVVEVSSFLIFCVVLYLFRYQIDLYLLLIFYSTYQFLKGLFYFLIFKNVFSFSEICFQKTFFVKASSFFGLTILGFLGSKIDLYIVAYFLENKTLGNYQIINSLLIFVMSISAFIYAPFTKNMYRTTDEFLGKVKKIIIYIGLIIVPISLLVVYFAINYFLNQKFGIAFYVIAFMYVFAPFVYGIDVVKLLKQKKQQKVIIISALIVFVNFICSTLFLMIKPEICSALAGSAVAQITGLVLFIRVENKSENFKNKLVL